MLDRLRLRLALVFFALMKHLDAKAGQCFKEHESVQAFVFLWRALFILGCVESDLDVGNFHVALVNKAIAL